MIPLVAAFVVAVVGPTWVDIALQDLPTWEVGLILGGLIVLAVVLAAWGILGGPKPGWWEEDT